MQEKQDNSAKEQIDRRSIIPGPYPDPCFPPYNPSYEVSLFHRAGDRVTVTGIDFTGVVTAIYIGAGMGVSYYVDNGKTEKCYPAEVLQTEYPYWKGGELPPGPPVHPMDAEA